MGKTVKKKVGRPEMIMGKRVHIIKAKLTAQELQHLQAMEKQLGLNRSEIIKNRVLHDSNRVLVNAQQLLTLLNEIGAELGRSGNNINQLARHANVLNKQGLLNADIVTGFDRLFNDYIRLQTELDKAFRQLIRLIK